MTTQAPSSFDELRQQWLARWNALAPRERQIALITTAVLVLAFLLLVAIRPAWRSSQQTPVQMREVDAQLEQMRRLAKESLALRQLPSVPAVQAEAALKDATDRLGEGARLLMQNDRANVTLTNVSGAALLDWLAEVRAVARVRPLEADLNQVSPGVYSGSMVLGMSPGPAAAR